jgi:hypothetical protein
VEVVRVKLKYVISLVVLTVVATFLITDSLSAGSVADVSQPGSVQDPLVTKGYVDQQIATLVKAEVAKITGGSTGTGTIAPLKVVQVKSGETLLIGAGGELIVRNGKVTAVSSTVNGIPNVTAGKDIAPGSVVSLNHLLIFPTDGRGIKFADVISVVVNTMVRGPYQKLNAAGAIIESGK